VKTVDQVVARLSPESCELLGRLYEHWCDPFHAHGKDHRNFIKRKAIAAGRVRLEQVDPNCGYHRDAPELVEDELALDELRRNGLVQIQRVSGGARNRGRIEILSLAVLGEEVAAWLSGRDAPVRRVIEPTASVEDELLSALSPGAHVLLIEAYDLSDSADDQVRKDAAMRMWRALQQLTIDCLAALGVADEITDREAASKRLGVALEALRESGTIGKTQANVARRLFSDSYDLVNRVRHQDHAPWEYRQAVRYALFASHEVAALVALSLLRTD